MEYIDPRYDCLTTATRLALFTADRTCQPIRADGAPIRLPRHARRPPGCVPYVANSRRPARRIPGARRDPPATSRISEPDDHGEPECDRETERERRESGWQNSTDVETATASVVNGQAHATRS